MINTSTKRGTLNEIQNWKEQISCIQSSSYQKQLWMKYQRTFKYAKDISFENSVSVVKEIMQTLV